MLQCEDVWDVCWLILTFPEVGGHIPTLDSYLDTDVQRDQMGFFFLMGSGEHTNHVISDTEKVKHEITNKKTGSMMCGNRVGWVPHERDGSGSLVMDLRIGHEPLEFRLGNLPVASSTTITFRSPHTSNPRLVTFSPIPEHYGLYWLLMTHL